MKKVWPQNAQTACTDVFSFYPFKGFKNLNRRIQQTLSNLALPDVVLPRLVGDEVRPVVDGAVAAHPQDEVPGEGAGLNWVAIIPSAPRRP